jgi:hypothetical protein
MSDALALCVIGLIELRGAWRRLVTWFEHLHHCADVGCFTPAAALAMRSRCNGDNGLSPVTRRSARSTDFHATWLHDTMPVPFGARI